ncbi:hypothetical protein ACIP27_26350, partial [Streptomyces hydrogenans]
LERPDCHGESTHAFWPEPEAYTEIIGALHHAGSRTYDEYAGRYKKSSGWVTGSKRYVLAYDGSHSVNDSKYWLVTGLSAGTQFSVASLYDGGDTVVITH